MAAEMVKSIMKVEAQAREMESIARKTAEKIINDAEIQSALVIKTSEDQAERQKNIIISEAEYSANGIIKQAQKLAELREKKSISDTEKKYSQAIELIFEEIVK